MRVTECSWGKRDELSEVCFLPISSPGCKWDCYDLRHRNHRLHLPLYGRADRVGLGASACSARGDSLAKMKWKWLALIESITPSRVTRNSSAVQINRYGWVSEFGEESGTLKNCLFFPKTKVLITKWWFWFGLFFTLLNLQILSWGSKQEALSASSKCCSCCHMMPRLPSSFHTGLRGLTSVIGRRMESH